MYVREKRGKRRFSPATASPDLVGCYWLRYEKNGKEIWQWVGHYDLLQRKKLLLERRLSVEVQGFPLPEGQAPKKVSSSRIMI